VAVIGAKLAAYRIAIGLAFVVQVLRALGALDLVHRTHPEVIGIDTEHPQRLLEGQLNLEAQAIQANDLDGRKRQIGGDEDQATPGWVIDQHVMHESPQCAYFGERDR